MIFTPLITITLLYILGIILGYWLDSFLINVNSPFFLILFLIVLISLPLFAFLLSRSKKQLQAKIASPSGPQRNMHRRNKYLVNALLGLEIIILGIFLYQIGLHPLSSRHIKNFISNEELNLRGTIIEEPDYQKNRVNLLIAAEEIRREGKIQKVKGKVRVTAFGKRAMGPPFKYADRVRVIGKLKEPYVKKEQGFDYKTYLARQGIFALLSTNRAAVLGKGKINPILLFVHRLREKMDEIISRTIPAGKQKSLAQKSGQQASGEEANLLRGVMLGQKKAISPEVRENFINSGVAHTLAVSGLHVGLIGLIFYYFFRRLHFSRRLCASINIPIIILYCLLTGARVPAVRASIMASVVLLSVILERENNIYNSLSLACLIILLMRPADLFTVSFQLSFMATLGIIYTSNLLIKNFKKILPYWLASPLGVSLAAQLSVYPLIAYYFHQVSLVAIFANLIVVPLLGIILCLGFISSILGMFNLFLAQISAWPNYLVLRGFLSSVQFFGNLPFASINIRPPSLLFMLGYYLLLPLLILKFQQKRSKKLLKF